MHIPDGMLSTPVAGATGLGAAGFAAYAVGWVRKHMDPRRVVLMAVMAALVFALQMLNFPVAAGTSGHFAGGTAAAILVGPWPAVILMTTVLGVQAVLFADGGLVAAGANVLNLGVIAPFVGYAVWRAGTHLRDTRGARAVSAFAGAWLSTVVAALAVAVELWLSGRASLPLVASAMGFWHALIGIGEGAVTAGLIGYLGTIRPDLVDSRRDGSAEGLRGVVIGLGLLALVSVGLSFLASSKPDGLEWVYSQRQLGRPFAQPDLFHSPLPDYLVPGLTNERLAGVLAGIVGVLVTGAALWVAFARGRQRDGRADENRTKL